MVAFCQMCFLKMMMMMMMIVQVRWKALAVYLVTNLFRRYRPSFVENMTKNILAYFLLETVYY